MEAVRKRLIVKDRGKVQMKGLPFGAGDHLEIIMIKEKSVIRKGGLTARQILETPLIGLWKERTDIRNSSEFSRELRNKAQNRKDR